MSIKLTISHESARRLPGTWHKVAPLDSGQLYRWKNAHGLGCYIEVTPDDFTGGYVLVVWVFDEKSDQTRTTGHDFKSKAAALREAYDWMGRHERTFVHSPLL